jgi:hypothetical protein
MKKIALSFLILIAAIMISNESNAAPRPFYFKIRIGLFAKWSITAGECRPGWGICISLTDNTGDNYIGYDNEATSYFTLKISKRSPEAKAFANGSYEVSEDSPIDPKVISQMTNLKVKDKVYVIKKGNYKVNDDNDYYMVNLNYYIQ